MSIVVFGVYGYRRFGGTYRLFDTSRYETTIDNRHLHRRENLRPRQEDRLMYGTWMELAQDPVQWRALVLAVLCWCFVFIWTLGSHNSVCTHCMLFLALVLLWWPCDNKVGHAWSWLSEQTKAVTHLLHLRSYLHCDANWHFELLLTHFWDCTRFKSGAGSRL
jgi:hypothetical protein